MQESTDLFAAARAYDARVAALVKQHQYDEALKLLRSRSDRDDIYHCICNDAPHEHRSSTRRLLVVRCLLAQEKKGEARQEVRALYESSLKPGYLIPDDADLLLIDLEPEDGYDAFEKWLAKFYPTDEKWYEGSIKEFVDLKKGIEAGRYDQAAAVLGQFNNDYHPYMAPRRLWARTRAVETYFVRNAPSLDFLLKRLVDRHLSGRNPDADNANRGLIHCIAEFGEPRAIPVLRQLREQAKNYWVRQELLIALAKLGDRSIVRDLLEWRGGNLAHQRYVDHLLRWLTKTSQGDIANKADAEIVFGRWEAWIKENSDSKKGTP